jgi:3-carboxy-cis,cis-muconate cycloisomerase
MRLLQPLFRWDPVEAEFSNHARVQGMLDFEAALARAEARAGVIPASAAAPIAAQCRAELFNMDELAQSAARAGNPAIPLIKRLTALVAATDQDAQRFVHWGATSQDALDTGLVLQLRAALRLMESEFEKFSSALAHLAEKHRATPIAARTWMQQALPTTFGMKAAAWLDAVNRDRLRLAEARRNAEVLQFGGAVGTLASLGAKGLDVAKALADDLHLALPDLPWHTQRDRIAEVATTLGLATGTLGKIARDISLHTQTEVAELFEPAAPGRGGSSTMPHKRNPVTCAVVLSAAARVPGLVGTMLSAMVQEQERGLGGWHAEWETFPEIISLAAGALHHLTATVSGLEVDTARMAANLELTHGLLFAEAIQMALGKTLGRQQAHELVEAACKNAQKENRHLRDVLADDPAVAKHLNKEALTKLFDPAQYLGVAEQFINRVLAAHAAQNTKKLSMKEGK